MVLFETDRTIVKRFTAADAEFFFQVNGDPDIMRFIRKPKNREESDLFLQENINFYQDGSTLGRYAVFEKGSEKFLGTFSFLYMSGDADFHLGYALIPEAWGKGFATELTRAGITYFFNQTEKPVIFAITEAANDASQAVLLKAGFIKKSQTEENGKTVDMFYITRSGEVLTDMENK
jgi:ribosomal-protein-alanine N-acetyltransferase